jgi:hypothetical protein
MPKDGIHDYKYDYKCNRKSNLRLHDYVVIEDSSLLPCNSSFG